MKINDANLKFAYTPGYRSANTELVLHHAAGNGSVEDIHRYHLGLGWAGIAYHFYIRKDGTIWRGRPENWLGGHTENHGNALGICFEGNFEKEAMNSAQIVAGNELVANVLSRYPEMRVYRHSQLNATACPGAKFPFQIITENKGDEKTEQEKFNEMFRAMMAQPNGDDPTEWAEGATSWAKKRGIFKGDGNGNFEWREPVTREEVAAVLYRYDSTFARATLLEDDEPPLELEGA